MKGEKFPAEWRTFTDEETGADITVLTNHRGHSNHLYFTNNGWYENNSKLVFQSDRFNRFNLFSIDLKTGGITQLTDLEQGPDEYGRDLQQSHVDPVTGKVYFRHRGGVHELCLDTLEERLIYQSPPDFSITSFGYTADHRFILASEMQNETAQTKEGYLMKEGYIGFREMFESHPYCRLRLISIGDGGVRDLFGENNWINHANTSSTIPHIATFCHEGPWDLVDSRMWGIDLRDGRIWPLRKRQGNEMTGHEYWFADGENIAYECHREVEGVSHRCFGVVRYDDALVLETDFAREASQFVGVNTISHVHSNNLELVVGDGNRDGNVLRVWKWDGKGFDGPRALCRHRCSFHIQQTHGHPRVTPDNRGVLFTNDENGYGNLWLVKLPERFEDLKPVEEFFAQ